MSFIERLADIVGSDTIYASPVDCLAYSRDMSLHVGTPQAIVFATDTAQVSKMVALANEEKMPVVARGTGSSVTGAVLAPKGGLIIDFTRMNKVKEINTADGYAVVEPGVICNALNAKLAPTHFFPAGSWQRADCHHRRNDRDKRQRRSCGKVRDDKGLREEPHRSAR